VKLGLIVPGGFDPSERKGIPALLSLTRELGRRHDVRVFSTAGYGGVTPYRVANAEVTQLALPGGEVTSSRPMRIARALARLVHLARELDRWLESVESSGPLTLLHAFWANQTAWLAALTGRRRRIPVVVSVGGGEAVWLPQLGYGGAGTLTGKVQTRAALRLADAITAGSSFAVDQLPAWAAVRARVVPLGVACATFAAPPTRPPGPPWRLLRVASLNLVKDHETLLAAMRGVVERLGPVRLDCVGEDARAGEAQRRARDLGVGSSVVFHGFLPQDALAALYRDAHLHLVSSRYESQSVAVLEAGAAGLPTVGTCVGLLPALAPGAATCVPPGDSAALAQAICELLLDGPAREAMGAAAQRFANAHDATWTAQTFERIYTSLLA
jgi:glycosyltransferase involved in cell wall biosynthesis